MRTETDVLEDLDMMLLHDDFLNRAAQYDVGRKALAKTKHIKVVERYDIGGENIELQVRGIPKRRFATIFASSKKSDIVSLLGDIIYDCVLAIDALEEV